MVEKTYKSITVSRIRYTWLDADMHKYSINSDSILLCSLIQTTLHSSVTFTIFFLFSIFDYSGTRVLHKPPYARPKILSFTRHPSICIQYNNPIQLNSSVNKQFARKNHTIVAATLRQLWPTSKHNNRSALTLNLSRLHGTHKSVRKSPTRSNDL